MSSSRESKNDDDLFYENGKARRADHRTLRLCRQIQEALQLGLAGECADEVLQQVFVASVRPSADPARLCVVVEVPADLSPVDVLARLEKARGLLRSFAAAAISRKKVPDLEFRTGSPEEGS